MHFDDKPLKTMHSQFGTQQSTAINNKMKKFNKDLPFNEIENHLNEVEKERLRVLVNEEVLRMKALIDKRYQSAPQTDY